MTDIEANTVLSAEQMPDVVVSVHTQYIEGQSIAAEKKYVFAYHVDIYNPSHHPVQLLTRHWLITDGDGQLQEVEGDGVVGETPVIAPGDSYQYSSGAVLSTQVGSMSGHYGMRLCLESEDATNDESLEDNSVFNASIPVFTLAVPSALN